MRLTPAAETQKGNRMIKAMKSLGCLSLLLTATACNTMVWDLEALRETQPTGAAFERALAREYLAFSESEAQQFDWTSSNYFARKGRAAAEGQIPLPEVVGDWRVDRTSVPALEQGRAQLMAALDGNARERLPDQAARAQALFDCWVEQQVEGWQTDHIAACRDGFSAALAALDAPPPQPAPQPAAAPPAAPPIPDVYMVFFDFDRDNLSPVGERVLDRVVEDFRRGEMSRIRLTGHTDLAGPDIYNQNLSERRVQAVSRYLQERGVETAQVETEAVGESRPRVPTQDGAAEAENRRVEIVLER